MYEYIKGKIERKSDDYLTIDTGSIGYKVYTSLNTLAHTGNCGDDVKIYTYLHVREDGWTLFGFSTAEERDVFVMLLSVSGVGPKAAIAILSALTPAAFGLAVVSEDAEALAQAKGIGKKTAQRIILELKDKVSKIRKEEFEPIIEKDIDRKDLRFAEAVNALIVLGYTGREARDAVKSVLDECETVEDLIRQSLKKLSSCKI
ncbi:MAG: Holliday junction branch migration protein RuvA [Clostridia bacterium]|jgi:Holliday junction DNA helicase RuvA|nr:Holliday junction branch migration protein RuvA [Clostridiaceae bacterium]